MNEKAMEMKGKRSNEFLKIIIVYFYLIFFPFNFPFVTDTTRGMDGHRGNGK